MSQSEVRSKCFCRTIVINVLRYALSNSDVSQLSSVICHALPRFANLTFRICYPKFFVTTVDAHLKVFGLWFIQLLSDYFALIWSFITARGTGGASTTIHLVCHSQIDVRQAWLLLLGCGLLIHNIHCSNCLVRTMLIVPRNSTLQCFESVMVQQDWF